MVTFLTKDQKFVHQGHQRASAAAKTHRTYTGFNLFQKQSVTGVRYCLVNDFEKLLAQHKENVTRKAVNETYQQVI